MSGAFTPGPWQFGHSGNNSFWIGPDYNQTPVAHVDHDTKFARDNSRDNARLIAAAPCLLARSDRHQASRWRNPQYLPWRAFESDRVSGW